ncbi:MAG: peptidyl-prolyl cis-trans isomerase [Blastocatellia bacterium]|nr:peptidyl-prolyl cis-trans isomerase [Blastocatellia bacterium]
MNSTTKALIAAAVAVAFSAGLIVWQVKARHAGGVNLTAEDMSMIAEDQGPGLQTQLAGDAKKRKDFADDVKRLFALSEEARSQGIGSDPKVKNQLELSRAIVVGQAYIKQQQKEHPGQAPLSDIRPEEIDGYLKQPGKEQQFNDFMKILQERAGPQQAEIKDEQKADLKKQWAQVYIAEKRATDKGLDKDRHVQLQIMLQEAQQLAREYAEKNLTKQVKATDAELDAYLAKHPKLDAAQAKQKAEDVLKQVKAGGDFAKLAKENSDDGSKDQGGDLGWFGHGQMVKPFEEAAFALQPGQTSEVVESQFGFHIIRVDDRRTQNGPDGKPEEQVHARHILIMKNDPQASPQGPQDDREKARAAVEQEKEKKILDEIAARSNVHVAEEFPVSKPEMPLMPFGPHGAGGPSGAGDAGAPEDMPPTEAPKSATPAPKKSTGKK